MRAWINPVERPGQVAHLPGPWQDEPDEVVWFHEGLPCFITRNGFGNWRGYVGVDESHPYYGHDDETEIELNVHGGVTFASRCDFRGAYFASELNEHGDLFWIGFDCQHYNDLSPLWSEHPANPNAVYRDLEYVVAETNRLAEQLSQSKHP